MIAANRIVMTNSLETSVYCYTPTNPLWVGDNRSCKFAPFNISYPGLNDQLIEAKLANPNPNNPSVLTYHPNKYNLVTDVEKSAIVNPPPSPSTGEIAFSAPTTVPPADFNVYSLPITFEDENRNANVSPLTTLDSSPKILSQILLNLPFKLTPEYEKAILTRTERLRHLNERLSTLQPDALAKIKSDISSGFKSWLAASGEIQ
eukprot:CAMPEP_0118669880 /NCGR_PEP_ID=MMETSP0785-20121206/21145_1 /TAXON_ID=91992 /ORGANISM="Bolidomonas pacifica, Strain CCMP 1866" /LENGTH=203 /DNA_ID=CAMNT_0006564609 /DNA_START=71 /DNA_END=678 /DNA_ORIENTATION=+